MRGQNFDITAYWHEGVKEPKTTSYMASLKGLQLRHDDEKAKIIDKEHTSVCMGGVIPDPNTIGTNKRRSAKFSGDLTTMT